MNRLIQLLIIGYVVGYAIVYSKGYQDTDEVVSACSTKVKGVTYTNLSDIEYQRVWDVADYVIPPQENNAFFVMTNAIITRNQSQSTCPEDPSHKDALCDTDADCTQGEPIPTGNGIQTGNCVDAVHEPGTKVCEIYAWCPVEWDDHFPQNDTALLLGSENFTVLIKNQIEFPKFGVKRRNILETQDKDYLSNCRYDAGDEQDRFCPIFRLGDIVKVAGEEYKTLAFYGGFISINIRWDCNLDKSIDKCVPHYSFKRLDDKNSAIAKGWNFRYANFYYEEGIQYRDLIKAYGIRFVINVNGEAGKFSFIPTILNFGSGLALLAVATVVCDIITMYILKKGYFYRERKYLYVQDVDSAMNAVYNDQDEAPNPSTEGDSEKPPAAQEGASSNVRQRPGDYNRLEEDD